MVEIVCKHSGVKFQAKTTRTEQHPKVARAKEDALKGQNYNLLLEIMEAVKAEQQWLDIDLFLARVNELIKTPIAQRNAEIAQRRFEAKEEAKERQSKKERRQRLNACLRSHGYRWSKIGFAEDADVDDWEYEAFGSERWALFAPDGREVSPTQALAEIKEATGVSYEA